MCATVNFVGVNLPSMCTGVNIEFVSTRSAYHHGDLRNALIDAASELAARGGPAAVTIRAAAREVGVTPTAAYRHFSGHDDLLDAAKHICLARMSEAMRKRLADLPDIADPVEAAIARLDAIGHGYVDFALANPGLFRTAFCLGKEAALDLHDPKHRMDPNNPHVLLIDLIDEFVRLGLVAEEQRAAAEIAAWSLVHGLSMLLIEGPLAGLPQAHKAAMADQAITLYAQSLRARA